MKIKMKTCTKQALITYDYFKTVFLLLLLLLTNTISKSLKHPPQVVTLAEQVKIGTL